MTTVIRVHCDAAAANLQKPGSAPSHPWLVLAATILASSLVLVDGSVVNVALPAIGHQMSAGAINLQWIVNAYLLPLSALLLLGGAAGDRFGRRRLLVAGITIFGFASLGCCLAPGLRVLLIARLMQGVGAAILLPNSLAILGQTFAGEARGRAIGIWAATGAIAGAVGPVLGGWLIDLGSWRNIFLINLPLVAMAIFLAARYVPADANSAGQKIDAFGGILAMAGLAALTWSLTMGSGPGGWTMTATEAASAGVALLAVFLFVEKRAGEHAMVPLALFRSRTFIGLTLLTLFLYGALSGLLVLIPYVLIEASGYSGAEAGAALLPLPVVLAVASPSLGGIAGRMGPRLPLAIGPAIVAIGCLLLLRIGVSTSYWAGVMPAMLFVAFGMSFAVAPLTTAVLGSVDSRHTGSASGLNSAVARLGGLIATALVGSVLAAQGARLLGAFHAAAIAGAIACGLASLSAVVLIEKQTV